MICIMSKEKLIDKQFLLIINGPSCGGKSAVSDVLFEKYGGIFKASSDKIKWLISDYEASVHREIVHKMTLGAMGVALDNGLSVLKEGAHWKPEDYVEMAKQHSVPLYIANIDAPWIELLKRFELRIEAKKNGAQISNTDPVRFKELYDSYMATKMLTPLEYDSSKQSPNEIADAIIAFLKTQ